MAGLAARSGLRIGRLETLIVLVGIYTFFVTFKPSEPFLVIFLRCVKKISRDDVSFAVFPIWTFAYLALLPIMCALAELIGYKLVVVLGAACRLITVMVLLVPFTDHSVSMMQLTQVTVAVGFAAHPALTAIMYRGLPREAYAKAVGVTASIGVVAEVVASLLGQLLISKGAAIWVCFALSAGFTAAGLIFATTLPSRPTVEAMRPSLMDENGLSPMPPLGQTSSLRSRAINGTEPPVSSTIGQGLAGPSIPLPAAPSTPGEASAQNGERDDRSCCSVCSPMEVRKAHLVWLDTLHLLRHSGALYYYLWLSVATAVHHLVVTYWQNAIPSHGHHGRRQLQTLAPAALAPYPEHWPSQAVMLVTPIDYNGDSGNGTAAGMYGNGTSICAEQPAQSINGYAQAIASLLGGAITLLPMTLERHLHPERCRTIRDGLMVVAPLAMAALLYLMSVLRTDYMYAVCYALFHVVFELLRILCEAEGARCVASTRVQGAPRFASVSGLTTTVALGIQAVLQLAFVPRSLGIKRESKPIVEQFQIEALLLLGLFAVYLVILLVRVAGDEGRRTVHRHFLRMVRGGGAGMATEDGVADSAAAHYHCFDDGGRAASSARGGAAAHSPE